MDLNPQHMFEITSAFILEKNVSCDCNWVMIVLRSILTYQEKTCMTSGNTSQHYVIGSIEHIIYHSPYKGK